MSGLLHRTAWTCLLALSVAGAALAHSGEFSFGVIAQAGQMRETAPLRQAIAAADADNLAFVVVNGVKPATEPCSDAIYEQRKNILDKSKNGLMVSLAAGDWTDCQDRQQRPAAVERLNRLRELFFEDEFSLGASRLPLIRQSASTIFRSYAENARWEIDRILFATVNLPANNNNFLPGAGRNSEFEDRQIATREWLERIFSIAQRKKMAGIVLFSDGDAFNLSNQATLFSMNRKRDGYREVRRNLSTLASRFAGKVLLIHGENAKENEEPPGAIVWQTNLGVLAAGNAGSSGWFKVNVRPAAADLFQVIPDPAD